MTAHTGSNTARAGRARRLVGIDVARCVAVLGMFNVHFGVPIFFGPLSGHVAHYSSGRSTALFTLLAGVSLAMLSGRTEPPRGADLQQARLRIAVRALLLIVVGLVLARVTAPTGFLLTVIIPFYGLYFLLCLPFVRLRARGLAIAAVCAAVIGPQLSFLLRGLLADTGPLAGVQAAFESVDPAHLFAGEGLFALLLTGFYPAAAYVPLVLAGMAVGRLDLRNTQVRIRLALVGLSAAVAAPVTATVLLTATNSAAPDDGWGSVPLDNPGGLLGTTPHSGTTLELLGAVGTGLVIVVVCLELADRLGSLLHPFAAAGSMALSLYTAHALVLAWQVVIGGWPMMRVPEDLAELARLGPELPKGPLVPGFPADASEPDGIVGFVNAWMSELFPIAALVLPVLWCLLFRRGPLEAAISEGVRAITARLQPLLPAHRTTGTSNETRQRS